MAGPGTPATSTVPSSPLAAQHPIQPPLASPAPTGGAPAPPPPVAAAAAAENVSVDQAAGGGGGNANLAPFFELDSYGFPKIGLKGGGTDGPSPQPKETQPQEIVVKEEVLVEAVSVVASTEEVGECPAPELQAEVGLEAEAALATSPPPSHSPVVVKEEVEDIPPAPSPTFNAFVVKEDDDMLSARPPSRLLEVKLEDVTSIIEETGNLFEEVASVVNEVVEITEVKEEVVDLQQEEVVETSITTPGHPSSISANKTEEEDAENLAALAPAVIIPPLPEMKEEVAAVTDVKLDQNESESVLSVPAAPDSVQLPEELSETAGAGAGASDESASSLTQQQQQQVNSRVCELFSLFFVKLMTYFFLISFCHFRMHC